AGVAAVQQQAVRAARLLGTADFLFELTNIHLQPADRDGYERVLAAIHTNLDAEALAAARAEGRRLPLDQAVRDALALATQPTPVVGAAPPLRLLALGPAKVMLAGRALAPTAFAYVKAQELLFYLLCHPPRTREQIGLALWPEASPA